jgi:hypothetical protein
MKISNSLRIVGGIAVAALFTTSQAGATIAYLYDSLLVGNLSGRPDAFGLVFNVNSPIVIDKLGAFDSGGDGFVGPGINVAVYSLTLTIPGNMSGGISSGTLVTSSDSLPAGNTMHPITPVTIGVGTYMIAAKGYGTFGLTDPIYLASGSGSSAVQYNPAVGPELTFGPGYYKNFGSYPLGSWSASLPPGWAIEGGFSGSGAIYGVANFDFTPVPEVEHYAMAGVGLLGLVYLGRCARLWRRTKLA